MSTPTAPPRIKAVVSVPVRRPKTDRKTDPTGAAATAATPTTEANAATSGRPHRMQCPGCSSTNIAFEDEGETICHDCGLVLADDTGLTSSSNDVSGYGLTRVNDVGRSLDHNKNLQLVGHSINISSAEDRRELYHSRGTADVKLWLEQMCAAFGLPTADAHRSLYLWTAFKKLKNLKITKYSRRAAVACLYVAAKESKREVTLNQFSSQTDTNARKFGSVYKDVKEVLLKHKYIGSGGNLEMDPWMFLDKVLTLDNEASIQSGLMDDLPPDLREALGVTLPPNAKAERLQTLLRVSQRCMTLAIESGMMTGRLPMPLAGACVVMAVQVEGKLALCPEELFEFIGKVWMSSPSTLKKRYMELKKYMVDSVKKLPFDVGGNRKTRTLFCLTAVLTYQPFFEKAPEDLWSGPETVSCDSDGNDGQDDVDEDVQEDPAENPTNASAGSGRVQAVEPSKPAETIEEVEEIVGEFEGTHMGVKRKLDLEMNSPPKKFRWHEQRQEQQPQEDEDEEEEDAVEQDDFSHHDDDDGYDYDYDDD
ncbi:hypothetical protein BGZ75_001237 [Mortierella antarctica]|nr:hypothetical protein BGZ75_001237 [Mortierella antarctica]